MAKNKRVESADSQKSASEYYHLPLQAVEDLVSADESNSPKVSAEELRKYQSGPKLRLTDWAKAILIKVWFAGAVCFFFLWGLGIYLPDQLDQLLILGLALGTVTDLLTNNLFRFYAKRPGDNDQWMMFPMKRFISLPLNILYAFVLLWLVVMTYSLLNRAIIAATGAVNTLPLGVGPILFGVFTTLWDLLLIRCKLTLRKIFRDAKNASGKPTKAG